MVQKVKRGTCTLLACLYALQTKRLDFVLMSAIEPEETIEPFNINSFLIRTTLGSPPSELDKIYTGYSTG
jgi:hypothetical protein